MNSGIIIESILSVLRPAGRNTPNQYLMEESACDLKNYFFFKKKKKKISKLPWVLDVTVSITDGFLENLFIALDRC